MQHPSPSSLAGRLWKAAVGLVLAAAGAVFVSYLWGAYQRAAEMDDWVETPCLIESVHIDDSTRTWRGMVNFTLEVRYRYEFGGREFTGERVRRLPVESADLQRIERRAADYRPGMETVCHVHPGDPAMAVLRKDTKAALYSIWFPCLFIVGGAGILLSALLPRRRRRPAA